MRKAPFNPDDVVQLDSLAPDYRERDHGTYLAALEHAIDRQPGARNIALAGPYGVGKSSVLTELARRRKRKVINISLLTLGVQPEPLGDTAHMNPAANTTTNRIQKEIVKQLLYQQSPGKTKQSRFRRIDRPHWWIELLAATIGGAVLVGVLLLAGVLDPPLRSVGIEPPSFGEWLPLVALAVLAVGAAGCIVLVARMISRGRIGIDKVAAGPATISLPARSTSYFDEYLDELIYFFEVNRRRDIVVIEDLDRFGDPLIYESLRSLNALLNAAHQLRRRNIRFVYAVRDSVFERLGREPDGPPDDTRAELGRGNRTKFFELIIPMVPLITHKNARDLLQRTLQSRGYSMSRELIDLAARHLPDMRLIHNIINEYEVFKRQLLDGPTPVPELTHERLFALMLVKNTQAKDFEAIRHGESSLDKLYDTWRAFVVANQDRLRDDTDQRHRRIQRQTASEEYAKQLAETLHSRIKGLVRATGSGLASGSISVNGSVIDEARLRTAAFWEDLRESDRTIDLVAHNTGSYNHQKMQIGIGELELLLGLSIDNAAFSAKAVAKDYAGTVQNGVALQFLRRHSWKDLFLRSEFTHSVAGGKALTFREWASELLPSSLVVELVEHGYVTEYFPLHVSAFYGELIRPDAMTYIMRNIDHGTADPEYPLEPEDVDAILADQGRSILSEPSVRNVSIIERLLVSDQPGATTIIRSLRGADGVAFINRYLSAGREKAIFVATLAPHAEFLLRYLVEDAPLELEDRIHLVSVAIDHRDLSVDYELDDSIAAFLEHHATRMPVFTIETGDHAQRAVDFLQYAAATLPDVSALSPAASAWIGGTRAYRFTAENLTHLTGSPSLALDRLHEHNDEMYRYALDEPEMYFAARAAASEISPTVDDASNFAAILRDTERWNSEHLAALVEGASEDCRIEVLGEVPAVSWPILAQESRAPATFENVAAYLNRFDDFDVPLATLLRNADRIDDVPDEDEEVRTRIAKAIINAGSKQIDVPHRIKLAASLQPEMLPITELTPERGLLVGELLRAGLIDDEASAFDTRLMLDWPTQQHAVVNSAAFEDFVGPDVLAPQFIAPLMRSVEVSSRVQAALVSAFGRYSTVPNDAFRAIAECALSGRIQLTPSEIAMLPRGDVPASDILELLNRGGEVVPLDLVRQTLRQLGEPYAAVADPGRRRPLLPATPALRGLLQRLRAVGIVSGWKNEAVGRVRVTMHRS
ncbi:YobI family P-loop NTPase [Curtobacterium aurantiacum]|uniref:YobI family P-loop NTPase n=1 Tax=Curtobacterium aurantiacum TaxID=3236919 RepID=UPI001BE05197|nr:hypothetical protein [Curtobacterium flaccumfaciens]MBT1675908.1 hypothetical protein [Curtobacterium flaccumfaciens pv. flaccumfaciens]